MVFVPATNVVEAFVEHTFNGKDGVGWVLHYESSMGAWDLAQMADLGNELVTWWDTNMQPLMAGSVSLQRIRMRDITTANGLVLDYTTGLPLAGTRSGAAMPGNVALSIKKNTGYAGRSFRGRIYQFGMVEGDVTANYIEAGYTTPLLAAWTQALLLVGAVGDYGMLVVSKYSAGSPRPLALETEVVSVSLADTRIDTRKDRL